MLLTNYVLLLPAAYDPGISPNFGGLPGLTQLKNLVGGASAAVLIMLALAAIISGVVWAFGAMSNRPGAGSAGKMGVVVALGGAFLVGAASFLIKWFAQAGAGIG